MASQGPRQERRRVGRTGRELLRGMAEDDAPGLVAEARAAARDRARAILEDAFVDELLEAVSSAQAIPADDRSPSAWWAYCVVAAGRAAEAAEDLMGVAPGSKVEVVVEGQLAMLVSEVPLSEYGDEELREHLEDIAWLERTARGHEAVQEAVLSRTALVPVRLCTIYHGIDRIRASLERNAEVFSRNLSSLTGTKEWGIKLFLDSPSGPRPAAAPPAERRPDSGAAYLAGRQLERDQSALADQLCQQCAEQIREAVGAVASEERINPVQRREAHGREAEMILNAAYLVADERVAALRKTVSDLQEQWPGQGLLVELTGPWPPYNFVTESAEMLS